MGYEIQTESTDLFYGPEGEDSNKKAFGKRSGVKSNKFVFKLRWELSIILLREINCWSRRNLKIGTMGIFKKNNYLRNRKSENHNHISKHCPYIIDGCLISYHWREGRKYVAFDFMGKSKDVPSAVSNFWKKLRHDLWYSPREKNEFVKIEVRILIRWETFLLDN